MKVIRISDIKNLNISAAECMDWIRESFALKYESVLPAKISLHPQGTDFFNTMPCLLPLQNRFGVKEVHRVEGSSPSLGSDYLLYDSSTGELLAFLDSDWITTMRTGAVAILAAQLFRKSDAEVYGFVGLGNSARAAMLCLLESEPEIMHKVVLKRYKDQAELFIKRFSSYSNVTFEVVDEMEELVKVSDVIISCITNAKGLLCEDVSLFKPGCLVVPVHTKGFQNCDAVFDRVSCDDIPHVSGFGNFDKFKNLSELSEILLGIKEGRKNDEERILSYNIGLGLHDLIFANKIYEKLKDRVADFPFEREMEKFWL